MTRPFAIFTAFGISLSLFANNTQAVDATGTVAVEEINRICPVSGQPADPNVTVVYEGKTYAFAGDAFRTKFNEAREHSLYQKLGGKAAIDAVVEAFYVKMLADDRVKDFFENINMTKQKRKQKEFLSAAFGGPTAWAGKDLRKAHEGLELAEAHFQAVAENLQKTMEEMKVKKELIDQVMAIAGSTHDDVLNRKPAVK